MCVCVQRNLNISASILVQRALNFVLLASFSSLPIRVLVPLTIHTQVIKTMHISIENPRGEKTPSIHKLYEQHKLFEQMNNKLILRCLSLLNISQDFGLGNWE